MRIQPVRSVSAKWFHALFASDGVFGSRPMRLSRGMHPNPPRGQFPITLFCGKDDAAAQHRVAVVQNRRLSRSRGPLRLVKENTDRVFAGGNRGRRALRLGISQLDPAADGLVRRLTGNPVKFPHADPGAKQRLLPAQRDRVP